MCLHIQQLGVNNRTTMCDGCIDEYKEIQMTKN